MARNQKFYDSGRWRYHTSPLVRKCNPICQRILDGGIQCDQPSEVVHHLVDPTVNPKRAHDFANLVATCAKHHPGGQPGETQGYTYCATIGLLEMVYYHPGGLLPSWHDKYKPPVPNSTGALPGTLSTVLGDDRLNQALGSQTDIDALLAGL